MRKSLMRGCFIVQLESLKCHAEMSKHKWAFEHTTIDPKPLKMIRLKLEDLHKQGAMRNKMHTFELVEDTRWVYLAVTVTEGMGKKFSLFNGHVLDSVGLSLSMEEKRKPYEVVYDATPIKPTSKDADNANTVADKTEKKNEEGLQIQIDEKEKVEVAAANERTKPLHRADVGPRGVLGERGSSTTTTTTGGEQPTSQENDASSEGLQEVGSTNPLLDYYDEDFEKAIQRLDIFKSCYTCCTSSQNLSRIMVRL
jgi:hypothetical protein